MKIKVWFHIADGGDGSAWITPYATKAEAEEAATKELEQFGQALCDNVVSVVLDPDDYMVVVDE